MDRRWTSEVPFGSIMMRSGSGQWKCVLGKGKYNIMMCSGSGHWTWVLGKGTLLHYDAFRLYSVKMCVRQS